MPDKLLKTELMTEVNPVYYTGALSLCDNNWRYDNVFIGFDKFYFIIEGECIIEVEGIRYTAKSGQLFFLPSNSTQTLYTEIGKTVKKYWFHCILPCGDQNFTELLQLPHRISVKDTAFVESLFQSILAKESESSFTSKLEQKADILRLLSYFIHSSEFSHISVNHDNRITYVIAYIEENLTRDLTLEELSGILHFHPSYFVRFFKAATGFTPIAYIQNCRIALAQKLLQNSSEAIQDISVKTGFRNPYYFSRCFRKVTGLSPTEYRKPTIKGTS